MKNATSIALSCPQKRTARRVASNARLLLGKLSAIVVLSRLSRRRIAADHDRPPSTARARRYPLNRATRLLYAMTTAAMPKQAAEANARLNTVIHMSRSP
jgi:hypothetical protein